LDSAETNSGPFKLRGGAGLLGALVVFQVVAPAAGSLGAGLAANLVVVSYVGVMVMAMRAVASRRRTLCWCLILTVPILAGSVISQARESVPGVIVLVLAMPAVLLVIWSVFGYVLRGSTIDNERLFGAGAVFLLITHLWGGLYAVAELFQPGAISHGGSEDPVIAGDLIYFSVVTQTTLGYGDLAPTTALARSIASLQSVTGIFFMGVVVARIVGPIGSRRQETNR